MSINYATHIEEMYNHLFGFKHIFALHGIDVYSTLHRLEYLLDKCHIKKNVTEIKRITVYLTGIFKLLIIKEKPFYIKPLPYMEEEDTEDLDNSIFDVLN